MGKNRKSYCEWLNDTHSDADPQDPNDMLGAAYWLLTAFISMIIIGVICLGGLYLLNIIFGDF